MESSDDQNHSNQCSESRCIAGDDEKKIVKVVVNVKELYFSFARNFRRINSCSTPKIIVDTFVSIVLKCQMNFRNCSTNKKGDFSKSASEKLKRAR